MLGLSQADLGVILGLLVPKDPSDPKPVGQQTVSRWEEGVNGHEEPPYWVQSALPKVFDRISEIQEALFRRVLPFVESLEASEDGLVHVPMYGRTGLSRVRCRRWRAGRRACGTARR